MPITANWAPSTSARRPYVRIANMTRSRPAVEKALEELQRLARLSSRQHDLGEKWRWGQVPEDLRDDEHAVLELVGSELDAL
jgi:hypothetical protein